MSNIRKEREAFRKQHNHEIEDKLRRFREALIKGRCTKPQDIERLEREYEKRLRGTNE